MKKNVGKKVVVAMSGGVDSSVSAALLKRAGFNVCGVFMKCWDERAGNTIGCSAQDDEYWARRAASAIGIPFYSMDLVDEYKKHVLDYFIAEYRAGRTPNPDIMCNSQIKFGIFLDYAMRDFSADFIATGHYAQIKRSRKLLASSDFADVSAKANRGGKITNYKLLRGIDRNKDQSYFLCRLGQKQLARTIFPVGSYTKSEVRALAREFHLPNAEKKDSQGLCFIGKVDVRDFLKERIHSRKGPVMTTGGKRAGTHDGAYYYTIGQRRGIGVAEGKPYYVVSKNMKTNVLIVGESNDARLSFRELKIADVHWVASPIKLPARLSASIRYRQEPQKVTVGIASNAALKLIFDKPQRAAAAGQSAVLYKGQEVVGSGVII